MTYELAKQLKDAGFPQTGKEIDGEYTFTPTLSELIEACGKGFAILARIGDKYIVSSKFENGFTRNQEFDTPEEAMAILWLELNQK